MKILLTGGGSGGHIIPVLAVVSELKKVLCKKGIEKPRFMFIGSKSCFNKSISETGIPVKIVKSGKLRRYFSFRNLADIFLIPIGVIQSLFFVYRFGPDVVFSKGGFASVPTVIAAWILKVPIVTHESDIVPGLANKIISCFADKILISFECSKKCFSSKKTVFTGNPIRMNILNGNKNYARTFFGFSKDLPTVLIFGGSQGAEKINNAVLESLPIILKKCHVIHICGANKYNKVAEKYRRLKLKNLSRYKLFSYLESEMKDAYALADVIVSRAGENSLAEIVALNKLSVVVPIANSANDHQLKNAEFFSKKGMITLIREDELTSERLTYELFRLLFEDEYASIIRRKLENYNCLENQNSARRVAVEIIKSFKPLC